MDMGSSTEKGLFTPASPVSPFGGRGDPALGHQFVKVGRGVADILQAFKPALAAERQIGLLLLFNMYFYGGHNCHNNTQGQRDPQNGQGIGGNPDTGSSAFLCGDVRPCGRRCQVPIC